ncbi:hypothetical protein MMC18_002628 [Xylographa bjoerkii]|nr:hypothetical protein [Xylographa bjoerkii]
MPDWTDRFMTPFYPYEDLLDSYGQIIPQFHREGLTVKQIRDKAEDMIYFNALHQHPPHPFDEAHILEVMRSFGPVVGQQSPERILELLKSKSRNNGSSAILHFINTTLTSSIMLDSTHTQLLCPPLVYFLRYASTPQAKARRTYHSDMAKLRKLMGQVLPYPNAGPERAKLKAYLMEVLCPFYEDHGDFLDGILDFKMQEYATFGNMLLLEPTSWEWDYSHDGPSSKLPVSPAFRQVRNSDGEPTHGEFDLKVEFCTIRDNDD